MEIFFQMVLTFSTWDEYELKIFTRESNEWITTAAKTERNDMFRAESLNFFGSIEGTEKNLCPLSEAKKSLVVCSQLNK